MKEILKQATMELAKDNIQKSDNAKYLTIETQQHSIYYHGITMPYNDSLCGEKYFADLENKLMEMGYKLTKI
jgi:hypothetical protein